MNQKFICNLCDWLVQFISEFFMQLSGNVISTTCFYKQTTASSHCGFPKADIEEEALDQGDRLEAHSCLMVD